MFQHPSLGYDVKNPLANRDVKKAYQATLSNEMAKLDKSGDPNQQLMQLFDTIKHSAEAEIGVKKPHQKQHYSQDNQLSTLIEKNTKLLAELHDDNGIHSPSPQSPSPQSPSPQSPSPLIRYKLTGFAVSALSTYMVNSVI